MSKILDLAKKLKALADQGVGGEKQNAQAKLDELIKKHGIDPGQLESDKVTARIFEFKQGEKDIVAHVIWIVGNNIKLFGHRDKEDTACIADITDIQFVEIQFMLDLYLTAWREELKLFRKAFIHKNNLYFTGEVEEAARPKPLSLAERIKLEQMTRAIDEQKRTKRITNG